MSNSKAYLTKEIPEIFKAKFPKDYVNDVRWWGNIPKEELHSTLPDGTAKMLTMDLDIGDICSLNCPHCFRRDPRFDKTNRQNRMTYKTIVGYIKDAKKLGLKQIKILGRGEPFENPRFLEFLRYMTKLDIGVAVFSKGHVMGSDILARRYNSHYGIKTGKDLIKEVKKLKVSILLGFNSFDDEMQEQFTGVDKYPDGVLMKKYVKLRNNALIGLVKAGFNKYVPGKATRLAMISAPCKPENLDQILDQYKWARKRNIYMLTCPTTISGKGADEAKRVKEHFKDYVPRLIKLWTDIYTWAIENKVIKMKDFKEDGVALYPGCHVCNQTAAGFYLNLSGQVNQCPGRVDKSTIFAKDIRETTLKDAWKSSANYQRAKNTNKYNYHCVARDGRSLPLDFYQEIEKRVLRRLKYHKKKK